MLKTEFMWDKFLTERDEAVFAAGGFGATAVDAFSLNYRVVLAEEGCFGRSEASHAISLCDMHAKHADGSCRVIYGFRLAIKGWMCWPKLSIPMMKSSNVSITPARPSIVSSSSSILATVA